MDLVREAAKFTAAGLGDMAEAVSTATTFVIAFGDDNITGAQALDAIARAAQLGEGDVADYARALKRTAAYANTAGLSYTELSSAMSTVSQVAPSVDQSGTQLLRFLQVLVKPTDRAREELEKLGYSVDQFRNMFSKKGFVEGFTELREQFIGDFGNDLDALGRVFDSVEAGQFLLNVRPENLERITQTHFDTNTDTVLRAFDVVRDNLAFKFKSLRELFLAELGDIGEEINKALPSETWDAIMRGVELMGNALGAAVGHIAKFLKYLYSMRKEIVLGIKVLAAWKAVMVAMATGKVIITLVAHLGRMLKALVLVKGGLLKARAAALAFNIAATLIPVVIGGIAYLGYKFKDEFTKIFQGITELAVIFYDNFGELSSTFGSDMAKFFKEFWDQFLAYMRGLLPRAEVVWKKFVALALNGVKKLLIELDKLPLLPDLTDEIEAIHNSVTATVLDVHRMERELNGKEPFKFAFTGLQDSVALIEQLMGGVLSEVGDGFKDLGPKIMDELKSIKESSPALLQRRFFARHRAWRRWRRRVRRRRDRARPAARRTGARRLRPQQAADEGSGAGGGQQHARRAEGRLQEGGFFRFGQHARGENPRSAHRQPVQQAGRVPERQISKLFRGTRGRHRSRQARPGSSGAAAGRGSRAHGGASKGFVLRGRTGDHQPVLHHGQR